MRTLLARLLLTALLLPGCRSQAGEGAIVDIEQSTAAAESQPVLKPPDAEAPASGACAEAQGPEAVVSFNTGFPDPRCLIVNAGQRLRIVNRLNREVPVELGSVSVIVGPGFDGVIGPRFGDYLAPGVHFLRESVYEGDPEIWFR